MLRGELDAAALLSRLDSLPPPPAAELQTLRAACLCMLERWEALRGPEEGGRTWDRAFAILGELFSGENPGVLSAARRERVLAFVLDGGSLSAGTWLAARIASRFGEDFGRIFTEAEQAALLGHEAVMEGEFGRGLRSLRRAAEADAGLFLRYPDLVNDLGRAWQFAAPGAGGTEQFSRWEQELRSARVGTGTANAGAAGSPLSTAGLRYRLLYFAGRIARAGGLYEEGAAFFGRALPLAPDGLQRDACVWYLLDMALNTDHGRGAAAAAKRLIPQWGDDAYFTDILDRLAQVLTADRRWEDMAEIYGLIEARGRGGVTAGGVSLARYAYILGRAAAEGYYLPEGAEGEAAAAGFLRTAWEAASAPGALYYRAMSAPLLGEPFLRPAAAGETAPAVPPGGRMEFLTGFFSHRGTAGESAAAFASAYIRDAAAELSAGELRLLAGELHDAGLYAEAIRLVSLYLERDGDEPGRRDLELLYPRPFKKLIEQNAREADLEPALLFGLIRSESAFQAGIVSRAGAVGLAQLMPATAEETAGRIKRRGGPDYTGEADLRDPAVNIHLGAAYLRYLTDRLESPLLALLAYNGGMNRVRRWRAAASGLPEDLFLETVEFAETREYGRRVSAAAAVYRYLYY